MYIDMFIKSAESAFKGYGVCEKNKRTNNNNKKNSQENRKVIAQC